MISCSLLLKRPFIWMIRFRRRCGYGVHSPFAFNLITNVIYEHRPYYAYDKLQRLSAESGLKSRLGWRERKVNRLLFRLVNWAQPHVVLRIGEASLSDLYLQEPIKSMAYCSGEALKDCKLDEQSLIDFLYINNLDAEEVERTFEEGAERVHPDSLFVVRGIHYSSDLRACWNRMKEDERVGITFDLYDVGLLFFNRKRIKQHYVVNF